MERYGGGGGDGGGNRCLEEVEVELRLYRTLGGGRGRSRIDWELDARWELMSPARQVSCMNSQQLHLP